MVHYATSTDFCLDPSAFLSIFAILILLNIVKTKESSEIEDLQKQLEIAHKHQEVMEEDIAMLQSTVDLLMNTSNKDPIEEMVVNLLKDKPDGMKCKYIFTALLPEMPELTNDSLNKVMCSMKSKNIVTTKKTNEKAPTWVLVE